MHLYKLKLYKFINFQVLIHFLLILFITSLIIFGNQFFLVLNQSLRDGLFVSELLPLLFLKFIRDTPFILGLSLAIAITYTLNKLYKTSEIIPIINGGLNELRIAKLIMPLVLIVVMLTGFLSIYYVPEIKFKITELKDIAKTRPDYIFFKEKNFQRFQNNKITFYTSKINEISQSEQELENVFIFFHEDEKLIISKIAHKFLTSDGKNILLKLENGSIYESFTNIDNLPRITNFKNYELVLFSNSVTKKHIDNDVNSMKFLNLFKSDNFKNLAEIQYRTSIPVSLLVISLISVFFAKINTRGRRNFSVGLSLITYILYYNMLMFVNTQIQSSGLIALALIPHAIFICLLVIIFHFRNNLILR